MQPECTVTVDHGDNVSSNEDVETILRFWFGEDAVDEQPAKADGQCQVGEEAQPRSGGINFDKMFFKRWFMGGTAVDQVIIERFAALHEKARKEELSSWEDDPRSALALLVLLDQFSRNIYRGTPQAFDQDDLALEVTKRAIEKGFDQQVGFGARGFFYLPFEHSEDIKNQNLAVEYAKKMVESSPANTKSDCQMFLEFAEKHKVVIERFGKFPHRDVILGRHSTAEEIEFLKQPGSSF